MYYDFFMSVKYFSSYIIAAAVFIIIPSPVFGLTTTPSVSSNITTDPTVITVTSVPDITNVVITGKPVDGNKRMQNNNASQSIKDSLKATRNASSAARKQQINILKDEFKLRRDEFKNKVQSIRDEKKKTILVSLDEKIASVSTKRVENMNTAIDKLEEILLKVEEKALLVKKQGTDTNNLDKAITEAKNAIASASSAIASQSVKQYVIPITGDSEAKLNAGTTIKALKQDLQVTHTTVVLARQSVMLAVRELKKVWNKTAITVQPNTTGVED